MENKHAFKLIDGDFTPSEANNLLFALVSNKINFLQLEAFSIKERFNGDASCSEMKVYELKEVYKSLQTVIKRAIENGHQLKINGSIQIVPIERA